MTPEMDLPSTGRYFVGLGEVLWDVYSDDAKFGGAPSNFAYHLHTLSQSSWGHRTHVVSAIGPETEELAGLTLEALKRLGLEYSLVQHTAFETGRVDVTLDSDGSPSYEFCKDPAWDHIQWQDSFSDVAPSTLAVCFGTLAQRNEVSRNTIQRFLSHVPQSSLRVFDVNLRRNFWNRQTIVDSLQLCNVLKLNHEELPIVAEACGLDARDSHVLHRVRERFDLQLVALTMGGDGARLVTDREMVEANAPRTEVRDTVGAGDSFTAAMIVGWLKGWDASLILQRAMAVASYVCTQSGATPPLPGKIVSLFAEP